jgi:hypothetical protein
VAGGGFWGNGRSAAAPETEPTVLRGLSGSHALPPQNKPPAAWKWEWKGLGDGMEGEGASGASPSLPDHMVTQVSYQAGTVGVLVDYRPNLASEPFDPCDKKVRGGFTTARYSFRVRLDCSYSACSVTCGEKKKKSPFGYCASLGRTRRGRAGSNLSCDLPNHVTGPTLAQCPRSIGIWRRRVPVQYITHLEPDTLCVFSQARGPGR